MVRISSSSWQQPIFPDVTLMLHRDIKVLMVLVIAVVAAVVVAVVAVAAVVQRNAAESKYIDQK